MTPDEVVLFIEGYEKRIDDWGAMMSQFVAPLMNVQIKSRSKRVKPRDLWQTREQLREKAKRVDPNVIDIEERRQLMSEFKKVGAPKLHRG